MSFDIASINLRKFSACLVRSLEQLELGQFGAAIDEARDLLAEIRADVVERDQRVLDCVVQQRGDDRRGVELQVGQDRRDFKGMREIGIAGGAELLAVRLHREDLGLVEQRLVGTGVVGLHPRDEVGLAHQGALGLGDVERAFDRGDVRVNPTLSPGGDFDGSHRSAHCDAQYIAIFWTCLQRAAYRGMSKISHEGDMAVFGM